MGRKEKRGGENGRLSRGSWEQQASGPGIVPLVIPGFPQLRQEVDQAGWEIYGGSDGECMRGQRKEVGKRRRTLFQTRRRLQWKITAMFSFMCRAHRSKRNVWAAGGCRRVGEHMDVRVSECIVGISRDKKQDPLLLKLRFDTLKCPSPSKRQTKRASDKRKVLKDCKTFFSLNVSERPWQVTWF